VLRGFARYLDGLSTPASDPDVCLPTGDYYRNAIRPRTLRPYASGGVRRFELTRVLT
jgi:hypothetical protein